MQLEIPGSWMKGKNPHLFPLTPLMLAQLPAPREHRHHCSAMAPMASAAGRRARPSSMRTARVAKDSEDAPLLGLPRRIEWLRKKTKDARPPSPAFTLVLREPDGDDTGYENAELI